MDNWGCVKGGGEPCGGRGYLGVVGGEGRSRSKTVSVKYVLGIMEF